MPINQTNQVDYLFKKIGYSVAKTDTTTAKSPSNETIASPLNLRGDVIWQQSGLIPATQPSSSTGVVTVYSDANSNTIKTTADSTSTTYRTWKTGITGWINPSFGATYSVKVYWDSTSTISPQTSGTQLFPDGTGNDDEWFFDYDAGVLTFPDNIPTTVAAGGTKTIYIVGAVYNGIIGIGNINANTIVGTLATANVGLYANVLTTSTNFNYYPILGNIFGGNTQHFVSSAITLNASTGNLTVSNVTATQFNGSLIGPVSTPTQTLITTVGTLTNLTVAGNTTTANLLATNGNIVNLISTVANISTANIVTANITTAVGNVATFTYLNSAVSTITNLTVTANTITGNLYTPQANVSTLIASGNVYAGALVGPFYGNVNTTWVLGGNGNVNIQPGGLSVTNLIGNTAVSLPVGTTLQRPANVAGYTRYNSDINSLEYFNGTIWVSVTGAISDQTFSGDGVSQSFSLNSATTASGILVSVNGVVQNPNTYTVNGAGTQITFSEIPLTTDVIDIRYLGAALATTSSYGNTQVAAYLLANPQGSTYSNSNVASYLVSGTDSTISTIQANVGTLYLGNSLTNSSLTAFKNYANLTFAIGSGNANITSALSSYSGNINANYLVANTIITSGSTSSNISGVNWLTANAITSGNLLTGNIYFANGTSYMYGVSNYMTSQFLTWAYNQSFSSPVTMGGTGTALNVLNGNINVGQNNTNFMGISTSGTIYAGTPYAGYNPANSVVAYGNVYVGFQNWPYGLYTYGGVFWAGNNQPYNGVNLYSNVTVASFLPTYSGNISANVHFGNTYAYANGVSILNGLYSNSNVASYLTTGNITIGNTFQQSGYYENFSNVTNSGGNLTCNLNSGDIFYAALTGNVTANFTNVIPAVGTTVSATIIFDLDVNPYTISNIQINGVNQTVRWAGGLSPYVTASNTNIASFSMFNLNGTIYRVLGQIGNYG